MRRDREKSLVAMAVAGKRRLLQATEETYRSLRIVHARARRTPSVVRSTSERATCVRACGFGVSQTFT